MKIAFVSLLAVAASMIGETCLAQAWEHRYLPADETEGLSVCVAGMFYSDGPFVVRIYDDTLDFYLSDDSFELPADVALGSVVFEFRDREFVIPAYSGAADGAFTATSHMFLTPTEQDVKAIVENLQYGDSFDILFPNGGSFTIDLSRSSAALAQAFECWRQNQTGGGSGNPFLSSGGVNPFH